VFGCFYGNARTLKWEHSRCNFITLLCNVAGIIYSNECEAAFWLADPCLAHAHKSKNTIYMFWQLHICRRAPLKSHNAWNANDAPRLAPARENLAASGSGEIYYESPHFHRLASTHACTTHVHTPTRKNKTESARKSQSRTLWNWRSKQSVGKNRLACCLLLTLTRALGVDECILKNAQHVVDTLSTLHYASDGM